MFCMNPLRAFQLMLIWPLVGFQAAFAIEPDFLMDSDPQLIVPQAEKSLDPHMKALWLQALNRPEIDMQRMAAETIARAHELGTPGLEEAIPLLEKHLTTNGTHVSVRFAAARALIAMDSRASSDKLFDAGQSSGAELRQLIEPVLAAWKYEPAKKIWLDRLKTAETRTRDLVLAIRCLGTIEETSATDLLISLVDDTTRDASLRLEAANAVGQIVTEGLEPKVEALVKRDDGPSAVNSLCGTRLLARHSSDATKQILISLANNGTPAVSSSALHRLNELDSATVAVLADKAIKSEDANVRLEAAIAYLGHPNDVRINALTSLLADSHPQVRQQTCDGLLKMANDSQHNEKIQVSTKEILEGDRWQGQQQAALLLGAMGYKPAANRLIELLDSPRNEVRVSAAWSLRKIAEPETIPRLIEKIRQKAEQQTSGKHPGIDEQIAHMLEALGVMRAMEALPTIQLYVPKNPLMGLRPRGAAIWALGRIFEGKRDQGIEEALMDRITDFEEKPAELSLIKEMAAVTLARMKAEDQVNSIRSLANSNALPIGPIVALRWALKELTNEELPPPTPIPLREEGWFLRPAQN